MLAATAGYAGVDETDPKEQDAVDFRRLVRANHERIDRKIVSDLAGQVWEKGSEEILDFIELTLKDQPLPI